MATWDFTFNGITFGGNNNIGVLDANGFSLPDVRQDVTDRAADHGAFNFSQFVAPRMVTIHGDITDSTAAGFATSINNLRTAFLPQTTDLPLVFQLPGESAKRIYCRPNKLDFPIDRDYQILYTDWNVQLLAADPRIYLDAASSTDIFANPGPTTGPAVNAGIFITPVVLTLTGPGTTWTIKNNTTGKTIKWNGTLTGGQTCVIDTDKKTIVKAGVSDYGNIDASTNWWGLIAGSNTVELTIGSGSTGASKVHLDWRSAWL